MHVISMDPFSGFQTGRVADHLATARLACEDAHAPLAGSSQQVEKGDTVRRQHPLLQPQTAVKGFSPAGGFM
jgi:hypothetical protein